MRSISQRGFTLIEVMVALGIAASALILLLAANRSALQRSMRARDHIQIEQACESKLDEILCGAETTLSGPLDGHPGYAWHLMQEPAEVDNVKNLMRVTFQVDGPTGAPLTRTFLHYGKLQETAPQKGTPP